MYLSNPQRIGIALVLIAAGILIYVSYVNVGNDDSDITVSGNEGVEALIPRRGSEILRQERVGIDLAPGYVGRLEVNGVAIPDSQTSRTEALNLIEFQPGDGKVIDELDAQTNCAVAFFWRVAEDPQTAQSISWCFEAT